MCEELEKELKRGQDAADTLIDHLVKMGAENARFPITNDNGCFVVEVRRTI